MAIFVVGYDLHPKQGETYDELIRAIKNVGTEWWHCLDSTWIVIADKTAAAVRDELKQHMRKDDQLLVIEHGGHRAAWRGFSDECGQWLKDNL